MTIASVASSIEAVTVYRRGALVRRVAELGAPGGDPSESWEIKLGGLPLCLDSGSVRARIEPLHGLADGAEVTGPVATDLRVALDIAEPDERQLPADDDALELACKRERRLAVDLRQIEQELEQLAVLTLQPRPAPWEGEPPRPSPTEARLALVSMRAKRERRLRAEHRKLRHELRQTQRRRAELEDQDHRGSSARQPRQDELRKAVVVRLSGGAKASQGARLCIEYLVPGARWAPAYAVRLGMDTHEASLAMRALVAQRTGEDWSGVALTLSTADAQAWTELPQLASIRIGRRQPLPPQAGWRPVPPGADELFADFDRSFRDQWAGAEPAPFAAPAVGGAASLDDEVAAYSAAEAADEPGDVICGLAEDLAEPEAAFNVPQMARMAKHEQPWGRARRSLAVPAAPPPPSPGAASMSLSAGAPAAAPMEAEAMLMDDSYGGLQAEQGGLGDGDDGPLHVGDQLLDYGRLRMPSPRSADRGKLAVVAEQDLYLQLWVQQRIEVTIDLGRALAWAQTEANGISDDGLSSRHQLAWSDSHDYAYLAEAPADVPSDGEYHSLPISQGASEAELSYVVVPRESCDVFRVAEITNPLGAPLLPGPVDVYRDGDFLISSVLSFTPAEATVELGMGVEQAVKVSRNTRFQERNVGLIGGSSALEHKIQIEALNHLDRTIDLSVRERVPVILEGEDDIKIEVGDVSPTWQVFEPFPTEAAAEVLDGGYCWTIVLAAGEKKTLWAEYEVRIPSKYELIGGNRREV